MSYPLLYLLAANVALAVGLSVGLFIFFFVGVPSFICILVYRLIHKQKSRRTVNIVTTAPSTGATTVVTSNQNTSFTTPAPAATPYPTQQSVSKDAKFGNQVAPPSYDSATGYPQVDIQCAIIYYVYLHALHYNCITICVTHRIEGLTT